MKEINIDKILELIPHRYPFLLVDKVIDCVPMKTIVGLKNVSMNEPQFTGHFPDFPVMPGVLIVEAMAQLCGLLVASSLNETADKKIIYFMAIDKAKFRKVVKPGDAIIMNAKVIQNRGNVWKFEASSQVDNQIVAESTLTAMVKDKDQ